MREILFRGKRVDNGEWVEGYLVVAYNPMVDENKSFIIENPAFYYGFSEFAIVTEVTPETVGQYTGLTDKNGNKIFEGDILKADLSDYTAVVDFGNFTDENNGDEYIGFYTKFNDFATTAAQLALEWAKNKIYIVGNIYDNPELLEV